MAIKDSKLPIGAKLFIVRCLARFERPRTILAHVEEHWNIQLHKSTVTHYNPRYNPDLDATMREVFDVTRAKFLEEKDNIGLNSLHVRQQMRDEFIEDAGRNVALKREILNDAAKDVGGQFSYRPTGVVAPDDSFSVM